MNRVMWVRDVHSPWDRAGEPDFREKVLGSISVIALLLFLCNIIFF